MTGVVAIAIVPLTIIYRSNICTVLFILCSNLFSEHTVKMFCFTVQWKQTRFRCLPQQQNPPRAHDRGGHSDLVQQIGTFPAWLHTLSRHVSLGSSCRSCSSTPDSPRLIKSPSQPYETTYPHMHTKFSQISSQKRYHTKATQFQLECIKYILRNMFLDDKYNKQSNCNTKTRPLLGKICVCLRAGKTKTTENNKVHHYSLYMYFFVFFPCAFFLYFIFCLAYSLQSSAESSQCHGCVSLSLS